MLPLPELDDLSFQEIVDEARKLIPQLYPEWTDENYHDPGITFIELLAWLTEMQQYYLNQITEKNELKFLKLMGIQPRKGSNAHTDVTFTRVQQLLKLPAGTPLLAGDQQFETAEALHLLPHTIKKIMVYTEGEYRDLTSFNDTRGLSYHAFGKDAAQGNHLLIGLDQGLPVGIEIALGLHMFEDYPVKTPPTDINIDDWVSPVRAVWKYHSQNGWVPLEIIDDSSFNFAKSGILKFFITEPMQALSPTENANYYWLGCFLDEEVYELPPRMEDITFNTVPAVQQNTRSKVYEMSSNGTAGMEFRISSYLALQGINQIQVKNEQGDWEFWTSVTDWTGVGSADKVYSIRTDGQETVIQFGNGTCGCIPPLGKNNIRLISYQPEFNEARWLGQSNGLPGQNYNLPETPSPAGSMILQVGVERASGEIVWQDWQEVSDFDASRSDDRHYVIDVKQNLISFGNHENGLIPPAAQRPNLLLLAFASGGGERGNVKAHEINQLLPLGDQYEGIQVENRRPAEGGSAAENLAEAKQRLKLEVREPQRAVTAQDFEQLALATPGLRVARVKAVPLYKPGMQDYPARQAEAQVTVAVMPYGDSLTPIPSPGFRETVRRYLDRHRLLTTEVQVVAPEYIKVSVYAQVVVAPGTLRAEEKIRAVLDEFLQPWDPNNLQRGWPFGRTLFRGDIYEVINRVPGVEQVKEMWLAAEGRGIRRELSGDVELPPCGLIYPGGHEIEIISRNDL